MINRLFAHPLVWVDLVEATLLIHWYILLTVVVVTGASGYIATHVVKQLQEGGYRVRGTVRSLQDENKVKHLQDLCPDAAHKLELVEADLTKPESWEA